MNKATIWWFPVVLFFSIMIKHIFAGEYYSAWLSFTTAWFAFLAAMKHNQTHYDRDKR